MKKVLLSIYLVTLAVVTRAQEPDFSLKDSVNLPLLAQGFNYGLQEEAFLVRINEERFKKKLPLLKETYMLKRTAYDQAITLADFGASEQVNPGERSVLYGGTRNVTELTGKISIGGGTDKLSYLKACNSIIDGWVNNSNASSILFDIAYEFVGISATTNLDGTKMLVSVIFGNKYSTAPPVDASASKFISTKLFELEAFHPKTCSKCDKVDKVEELAKGLVVEGNSIYLYVDNFKSIKQLIKTQEDGLAVDIVSKSQFACGRDNIINYSLPNRGFMLEPLFFNEILNNNLEEAKQGRGKVKLGNLPKGMHKDSVELNLVIIIQNKICKNIFKPYIEISKLSFSFEPDLLIRKDPRFPNDIPVAIGTIDKAYNERMCKRCSDPFYQNPYNLYNCVVSSLQLSKLTTDAEYQQAKTKFEKVKSSGKISGDSIFSLEMAIYFQALGSKLISGPTRAEIINKINDVEPTQLSINNTLAFFTFYINTNNYKRALLWLDQVIMSPEIPEDLIFTYLSLSALYSSRMNGGTFPKVVELAHTKNSERFCQLFSPSGLSLQVMENQYVKEIVCKTCPVTKEEDKK